MLSRIKKLFSLKTLLSAFFVFHMATGSGVTLAQLAKSDMAVQERPSILAMYTDLLVLRPVGAVTTVLGAAAYVVSLPFTLPVGNATEVGNALVAEPAKFTFARCLGCTKTGYTKEVGKETSADAAESGTW